MLQSLLSMLVTEKKKHFACVMHCHTVPRLLKTPQPLCHLVAMTAYSLRAFRFN